MSGTADAAEFPATHARPVPAVFAVAWLAPMATRPPSRESAVADARFPAV
jgi:hypothetical protein